MMSHSSYSRSTTCDFHKKFSSSLQLLQFCLATLPPTSFTPIAGVSRLDDQIFINRNPGVPSVVKFHPFNTCIAVADKDSIWSGKHNTH